MKLIKAAIATNTAPDWRPDGISFDLGKSPNENNILNFGYEYNNLHILLEKQRDMIYFCVEIDNSFIRAYGVVTRRLDNYNTVSAIQKVDKRLLDNRTFIKLKSLGVCIYSILFKEFGKLIGDISQSPYARRVWYELSHIGKVNLVDFSGRRPIIAQSNIKLTDSNDTRIWVNEALADSDFSQHTQNVAMNYYLTLEDIKLKGLKRYAI